MTHWTVRLDKILVLLVGAAFFLTGCTTLFSFQDVRRNAPGRYIDVDGVALHVEDRGSGDPVVLLHGFGASTWSWRYVAPALAESYRVIAIDLLGFGATQRPRDLDLYDRDRQLEFLLDAFDELGLQRFHLVGHSYGGALSMGLATMAPERIRSLVLVNSAAPDYPDARRGLLGALPPTAFLFVRGVALHREAVVRTLKRSFADDSKIDDDLIQGYLDRLRVEGVARAYRGLTRPRPSGYHGVDFRKIATPTLAVWGSEDTLIPAEEARSKVALFPDARFVEIPGCGHIPLEECPEPLTEAILEFFDSQPAAEKSAAHAAPSTGRTSDSVDGST